MSNKSGCLAVVFGTFLAHLITLVLTFIWGTYYGANSGLMGPRQSVHYGWDGGVVAVGNLPFYYLMAVYIPVGVSGVGAFLGFFYWGGLAIFSPRWWGTAPMDQAMHRQFLMELPSDRPTPNPSPTDATQLPPSDYPFEPVDKHDEPKTGPTPS